MLSSWVHTQVHLVWLPPLVPQVFCPQGFGKILEKLSSICPKVSDFTLLGESLAQPLLKRSILDLWGTSSSDVQVGFRCGGTSLALSDVFLKASSSDSGCGSWSISTGPWPALSRCLVRYLRSPEELKFRSLSVQVFIFVRGGIVILWDFSHDADEPSRPGHLATPTSDSVSMETTTSGQVSRESSSRGFVCSFKH